MDYVISEPCYEETISQRNYQVLENDLFVVTLVWPFHGHFPTISKTLGEKIEIHNMARI